MMVELKPCPFCGGEAALKEMAPYPNQAPDRWFVTCEACDVLPDSAWDEPKAEAIAAWNTRAIISTGDDAGLVEQLTRLLAGFNGENDLSVGPHMLAQGVHEARAAILSLTARNKELEEALPVFARVTQLADALSCDVPVTAASRAKIAEAQKTLAALNHQDHRQKEGGE
jgi:Lar family restriction alleviation protein